MPDPSATPCADTPSGPCDALARLKQIDAAREQLEQLAADYWSALSLRLRDALQAVSHLPLSDPAGWSDAVLSLAAEMRAAGLEHLPAELRGQPRNRVRHDDSAEAVASAAVGQEFCGVLDTALNGDTSSVERFFGLLRSYPAMRQAAFSVTHILLDNILYLHIKKVCERFYTRALTITSAIPEVSGSLWRTNWALGKAGYALSESAVAAVADWNASTQLGGFQWCLQRRWDTSEPDAPAETDPTPSDAHTDEQHGEGVVLEVPISDDANGGEYPKLSDTAWAMVAELQTARAFGESKRVTLAALASTLGGMRTAEDLKRYSRELREAGYLKTRDGRGGGIWLTSTGRQLRHPDQ